MEYMSTALGRLLSPTEFLFISSRRSTQSHVQLYITYCIETAQARYNLMSGCTSALPPAVVRPDAPPSHGPIPHIFLFHSKVPFLPSVSTTVKWDNSTHWLLTNQISCGWWYSMTNNRSAVHILWGQKKYNMVMTGCWCWKNKLPVLLFKWDLLTMSWRWRGCKSFYQ